MITGIEGSPAPMTETNRISAIQLTHLVYAMGPTVLARDLDVLPPLFSD